MNSFPRTEDSSLAFAFLGRKATTAREAKSTAATSSKRGSRKKGAGESPCSCREGQKGAKSDTGQSKCAIHVVH